VIADVRVDREDTDSRVVLAVAGVVLLGICWVGLTSLTRVVRSARAGDPFDHRNVVRLRWLSGAVLALPVVNGAVTRVLNGTLEMQAPVTVVARGPRWWMYGLIALALLALSEVFAVGSSLRDFERETV
jgi:hypothetical protein